MLNEKIVTKYLFKKKELVLKVNFERRGFLLGNICFFVCFHFCFIIV